MDEFRNKDHFKMYCRIYHHFLKITNSEIRITYIGGTRIPLGGAVDLVGEAWTPEAAMFQKSLYVKMKESGPLGP